MRWLSSLAVFFSVQVVSFVVFTVPATAAEQGKLRALLVGCTTYDHMPGADLEGGTNDVNMLADVLIDRYRFSKDDIVRLIESNNRRRRKKSRPTRANIEREFKRLAKEAQRGDWVVVLLSGHGTQQPDDDPDNPDDPEPDGMDEVFCPADVKAIDDFTVLNIPNGITDDDLRQWLTAIRRKGAGVWVIIDACHSGTATRGGEVVRQLPPESLVPKEALERARTTTRGLQQETNDLAARDTADQRLGGLVAIYAAQPDEMTIEIPIPEFSLNPQWHGLLTYVMTEVLTQAERNLTYDELARRIHGAYALSRGRMGPTPLIEGPDRHREILGTKQWPQRSKLTVQPTPTGETGVNAGRLHGLTTGSILAVYPPAGEQDPDKLLGHVRVTEARTVDSLVERCAYGKTPKPDKVPVSARCQVVFVDYGDLRLKVHLEAQDENADQLSVEVWRKELREASQKPGALFRQIDSPDKADWIVSLTAAGELFMQPARGASKAEQKRRVTFGPIPADIEAAGRIRERLTQIARVGNLLRITREAGKPPQSALMTLLFGGDPNATDIRVELRRLAKADDPQGTPVRWDRQGVELNTGDLISLTVTNRSSYQVDFSLLFVDSAYGITPVFPPADYVADNRLQPNQSQTIGPMEIEGDSLGLEHLVVVATRALGQPIDFSWLAQDSLERESATRSGQQAAIDTPFGQLFQQALFASGTTRGVSSVDLNAVTFRVVSWQTVDK